MAGEQVSAMLEGIENLWGCLDELFRDIEARSAWGEKHGEDWTFADVPYHLMYFDRELVARALERGKDVPTAEQRTQRTLAELNAWNAALFAERPAGQTPQQSVEQWHAMCGRARAKIASLRDDELNDPVWLQLVGCGWLPAMASVLSCLAHNWSGFIQLRHLMGRSDPEPAPAATHAAAGFLMNFLPAFMDAKKAKETRLTYVAELTGPGGGAWTFRIADGGCEVTEERSPDADLIVSQTLPPQSSFAPARSLSNRRCRAARFRSREWSTYRPSASSSRSRRWKRSSPLPGLARSTNPLPAGEG